MKLRKVLVASAAAFAFAAAIAARPCAAPAQEIGVSESSANPPLRLLSVKGNSFDGFFQQGELGVGGYCGYCDGPGCGCFFADSNGGTGSLKYDSTAPVSMSWSLGLYYAGSDQLDNGEYGSCQPASGFINTQTGANNRNVVYYYTTGAICDTGEFNQTYTGSYYVDGGYGGYSTTAGSGSVAVSIYSWENSPVLNSQLQLTGNIARAPAS
ncbi:MAG: hypothetical protein ABSG46_08975 [Candidatus Binataceae bacterium]